MRSESFYRSLLKVYRISAWTFPGCSFLVVTMSRVECHLMMTVESVDVIKMSQNQKIARA